MAPGLHFTPATSPRAADDFTFDYSGAAGRKLPVAASGHWPISTSGLEKRFDTAQIRKR